MFSVAAVMIMSVVVAAIIIMMVIVAAIIIMTVVVIAGPPGVGRKTLVQRLMSLRSGHFKTPVTCK